MSNGSDPWSPYLGTAKAVSRFKKLSTDGQSQGSDDPSEGGDRGLNYDDRRSRLKFWKKREQKASGGDGMQAVADPLDGRLSGYPPAPNGSISANRLYGQQSVSSYASPAPSDSAWQAPPDNRQTWYSNTSNQTQGSWSARQQTDPTHMGGGHYGAPPMLGYQRTEEPASYHPEQQAPPYGQADIGLAYGGQQSQDQSVDSYSRQSSANWGANPAGGSASNLCEHQQLYSHCFQCGQQRQTHPYR